MNSNTIASVGSLYPAAHVFNVADQTAANLATTERMFRFNNANPAALASVNIPLGTEIYGSVSPFDPESNVVLSGQFGSMLAGRSRSGRPYFSSVSFDNRPFKVRAVVSADLTASAVAGGTSVLFGLYCGSSLTVGSNTKIADTGAAVNIAVNKVSHLAGVIEATLCWDSVSQALAGIYQSSFGGSVDTGVAATIHQVVAPAAILNGPVASTTLAKLVFGVSCAVSVNAAASGSVSLKELSIEQL